MNKKFFINNKVLNINLVYILSLLPIIIFSSYKNGLLLVNMNKMNVIISFKYLCYPILILAISYVLEYIYYRIIKDDKDNNNVVNSCIPFFNLLCYLVSGPNDNILIIISLIILVNLFSKVVNVNYVALYKIILFIVLNIYGIYNNANMIQNSNDYSMLNLFIGYGIGEMGYTSLFSLISFIVLIFNEYYKKDIPIMIFISYMLMSLLLCLFDGFNLDLIFSNIFNSGLLFIIIFICSMSLYSPVTFKEKVIYSSILGILFSIFVNVFDFYIGIYIVILGYSLAKIIIKYIKDRIIS